MAEDCQVKSHELEQMIKKPYPIREVNFGIRRKKNEKGTSFYLGLLAVTSSSMFREKLKNEERKHQKRNKLVNLEGNCREQISTL